MSCHLTGLHLLVLNIEESTHPLWVSEQDHSNSRAALCLVTQRDIRHEGHERHELLLPFSALDCRSGQTHGSGTGSCFTSGASSPKCSETSSLPQTSLPSQLGPTHSHCFSSLGGGLGHVSTSIASPCCSTIKSWPSLSPSLGLWTPKGKRRRRRLQEPVSGTLLIIM